MPWRDSPFSPQIEISVMSTDAEIQSENERPSGKDLLHPIK